MSSVKNLKKQLDAQRKQTADVVAEQAELKKMLEDALTQIKVLSKKEPAELAAEEEESVTLLPNQVVIDICVLDELHSRFDALNETVNDMVNKMSYYDNEIYDLHHRVTCVEAQTRRDSLLFHNLSDIPSDRSEFNMIGYVCHKLNTIMPRRFPIMPNHISTAHLITPRNKDNKTPILLVKFAFRWLRNDFFYDRNAILDRSVSITEHLCGYRLYLLRVARKAVGYSNVYTDQAQVYIKGKQKYDIKVQNLDDIKKATRRTSVQRE